MKIITINAKRLYPVFMTAKITVITVALLLSALLALRYVLDTPLYILSATDVGAEKTVIIDAGHGGEDCGAVGINGVYEKSLNLEIANLLADELSGAGFSVIMTRTEDRLLYTEEENIRGIRKISDLKNRVKIAKEYPEAIFVSVHMNSYKTEKYYGFQAYYNGKDERSRLLADTVQRTVREKLQPENKRVIKDGGELHILKNAPTCTVLLECGFLSNKEECEKLCEKEYQKELSFAVACGIIEYIEMQN